SSYLPDVDECSLNTHDCHSNAICTNTEGSFTCKCDVNAHYIGDGKTCTPLRGLDDSVIIANDASKISQLNTWLLPHLQSQDRSYWKLCYRASNNGWRSQTFHRNCDNKGPTITIVRVGSYIFGGYNDNSWQWSAGYQYSTNTFLYSLKNYKGYGYFKQDITNGHYGRATYSHYSYGPIFGEGHDMIISNNAGRNTYSYFQCRSYLSGPYCDNYLWVGSRYGNHFRPDELEVYYEVLA
ncbi:unnamed protein product, partial [Porites evermanni]